MALRGRMSTNVAMARVPLNNACSTSGGRAKS